MSSPGIAAVHRRQCRDLDVQSSCLCATEERTRDRQCLKDILSHSIRGCGHVLGSNERGVAIRSVRQHLGQRTFSTPASAVLQLASPMLTRRWVCVPCNRTEVTKVTMVLWIPAWLPVVPLTLSRPEHCDRLDVVYHRIFIHSRDMQVVAICTFHFLTSNKELQFSSLRLLLWRFLMSITDFSPPLCRCRPSECETLVIMCTLTKRKHRNVCVSEACGNMFSTLHSSTCDFLFLATIITLTWNTHVLALSLPLLCYRNSLRGAQHGSISLGEARRNMNSLTLIVSCHL